MEVITLEGDPSSGKTQTLNLVYALLIQAGYTQVLGAFQSLDKKKNDCLDVFDGFSITKRVNQRIGVVTQGDYGKGPRSVKNHLSRLQSFGCDIVICTCSIGKNQQAIEAAIRAYSPYSFILKVKSQSVELERIDNFNCAVKIMGMI